MSNFEPSNHRPIPTQCVVSHRSLPAGRAFAKLTFTQLAILAQTDGDHELELPLKGIKLSWGGANDKLLFITHPDYPEWSIFTRDRAVLAHLKATGSPDVEDALSELAHERRYVLRRTLIAAAVLLAIVWGTLVLWKPAVAMCANVVPFSWEKKLGEAVFFTVQTQTPIVSDEGLTQELSRFVAPLKQVAGEKSDDLTFYIATSENLNAFALPGGKIILNSGTILNAARPEELYGVLAHEISHVTLRHTTRQMISVFGVYMAVDLILGNIIGTVAAVGQGASYLLQQGFSRDQEREADQQGLAYLLEAGIDPRGIIEFFNRIEREKAAHETLSEIDKNLSFLSTHPTSRERISDLSRQIEAHSQQAFRSFPSAEFDAFKEKLRTALRTTR